MLWDNLIKVIIKWVFAPFGLRKNLKLGQKGASSIMYVTGLAAIGLLVVEGVERQVNNSSTGQQQAAQDLHLQYANETALAQLSQLIGATIINVDEARMKFIRNTQLDSATTAQMTQGNDFTTFSDGKQTWKLNNSTGRVTIDLCIKPNVNYDNTYRDVDDSSSWTGPIDGCPETNKVRTDIDPREFVPADQIEDLNWSAVRVDSVTYYVADTSKKYSKSARINYLPPTQQCDINSEETKSDGRCSVDHCKFMQPHKDPASGQILYRQEDGALKMALSPNPNYVETMRIRLLSNIPRLNADYNEYQQKVANDGVALKDFVEKSLEYGMHDPFVEPQGVYPHLVSQEFLKNDGSGFVTFDIKAMQNSGDTIDTLGADDLIRFEGFLYATRQGGGWKWGSVAMDWQTPTTDNMERMKAACSMTLGLNDPNVDFCSRLNLTYARFGYEYRKLKRCTYHGPDAKEVSGFNFNSNDVVGWLKEGGLEFDSLKKWDNNISYILADGWKDSAESKAEVKVSKVTGNYYEDPVEDFHISWDTFISNPDQSFGDLVIKAQDDVKNVYKFRSYHMFSDVFDGQIELVQIVKKSGDEINDAVAALKAADGETPKEEKEYQAAVPKYKERKIVLKFQAGCEYQDVTASKSTEINQYHVFDQCFYVAYFKSKDRLNCYIQAPNNIACRNGNGCFTPDTPILMADGSYKEIKDISVNDYVMSPTEGIPLRVAKLIRGPEKRSMYKISYTQNGENKHLKATFNHPFVTQKGILQSQQLSIKDFLISDKMEYLPITSIDLLPVENNDVLNIELEDISGKNAYLNHMIVANGILSGDYYIQQNYYRFKDDDHRSFTQFMLEKDLKELDR